MHGVGKADRGIWHDRETNKSLTVTPETWGHKHFMLSVCVRERWGKRWCNSEACALHMKDFFVHLGIDLVKATSSLT